VTTTENAPRRPLLLRAALFIVAVIAALSVLGIVFFMLLLAVALPPAWPALVVLAGYGIDHVRWRRRGHRHTVVGHVRELWTTYRESRRVVHIAATGGAAAALAYIAYEAITLGELPRGVEWVMTGLITVGVALAVALIAAHIIRWRGDGSVEAVRPEVDDNAGHSDPQLLLEGGGRDG